MTAFCLFSFYFVFFWYRTGGVVECLRMSSNVLEGLPLPIGSLNQKMIAFCLFSMEFGVFSWYRAGGALEGLRRS